MALYALLFALRPLIDAACGLYLDIELPSQIELMALGAIVLGGCLAGLLPAGRAYRLSLADGMMVRT